MLLENNLIPRESIEQKIFIVRGKRIMLDFDLAKLYLVPTKRLNEAVKRNIDRFPQDFMFRLNTREVQILNRSQIAASSQKHRDRYYIPYAFTEQGVAMLSSVLRSERAVQVNIAIMRAFIKMRALMFTQKELEIKIIEIEKQIGSHDQNFKTVFEVLRKLLQPKHEPPPPEISKPKIGFGE